MLESVQYHSTVKYTHICIHSPVNTHILLHVALSREFTFNSGVAGPQCENIFIVDDSTVENAVEFFTVEATSAGLTTKTLIIIISDSDRMWSASTLCAL